MAEKKRRFAYEITEKDQLDFLQGTNYEIYKKLGAHIVKKAGKMGVYFAVWAPKAKKVSVVGDFNEWNQNVHVMKRNEPAGIYTLFVPEVKEGALYKYCIETSKGFLHYKADPYGNYTELRPGNASIVTDLTKLKWSDEKWTDKRKDWNHKGQPVSIYEVHIGSWRRHEDTETGFYNYREFAREITSYVKKMGYTHIELMGIAEYPFDGSWGYQVTGYFAPTSRYGTPSDFAWMINYLHKHGIGVIMDWVPAHFPKDEHGLVWFDGSPLYEYADDRKGEHPEWGTKVFDYAKNEVQNFLISSAHYWAEEFHVDGLRVDAVASMIYLDYGKSYGQWLPNEFGDNRNTEAVAFLQKLNATMHENHPGVMMIAEESTAWAHVTGDFEEGLGFDLKWNMGWMHDFLEYMKLDPIYRKYHHHRLTFGMVYAFSENFALVLSHDEVVHLKCSMLNKMPGTGYDKFANLKVGYAFMMGHVGKKLLFMGQEFGEPREWNENRELQWELLEKDSHSQLQLWVKDLLHLYKRRGAMYEQDDSWDGFEWINADDTDHSIYSFIRRGKSGKNLLFVFNFTPVERSEYRVGVPKLKQYKLILDSDASKYGGSGVEKPLIYKAEEISADNRDYSISYKLPGYGVAIFEF